MAPTAYIARDLLHIYNDAQGQRLAFAGGGQVPLWLGLIYLASNLTLNSLNVFWFGKMIETIRKRFDPPFGTKGVGSDDVHYEPQEKVIAAADELVDSQEANREKGSLKPKGSVKAARQKAEQAMNAPLDSDEAMQIQRATLPNGSNSVEISGTRTLRTRRKA